MGLNVDLGGPIYDDIISHARIPAAIFQGSPDRVDALNEALRMAHALIEVILVGRRLRGSPCSRCSQIHPSPCRNENPANCLVLAGTLKHPNSVNSAAATEEPSCQTMTAASAVSYRQVPMPNSEGHWLAYPGAPGCALWRSRRVAKVMTV